jgi:hypothetical protein
MDQAVNTLLQRLSLLLALLALPTGALAHRLDEYLQATLVSIEPGDVRLEINLTPGVSVAEPIIALIDRDRDGAIWAGEANAYAEMLKHDLTVRLDDREMELKVGAVNFPEIADLRKGWGVMQIEFTVSPGSLTTGEHRLTLADQHLAAASVYLINAAKPRSGSIQIIRQTRNQTQSTGEIEFAYHPPASPPRSGRTPVCVGALLLAGFAVVWWVRSGRKFTE